MTGVYCSEYGLEPLSQNTLNDWRECNWPVVIQTGHWALFGDWDDSGSFKAGGDCDLSKEQVKDGGENISQPCSTCPEGPPGYVKWACCPYNP